MNLTVFPSTLLQGEITLPGDKSISHRALILSAIADGTSHIQNFLFSEDCLATVSALRACGVEIILYPDTHEAIVKGVGYYGLTAPAHAIDCGNSGTSMRLLAGLLSGQHFSSELTGDESLSKRPMNRIIMPLRQMGADISGNIDQFSPLRIHPPLQPQIESSHHISSLEREVQPNVHQIPFLKGITYTLPMPSAQVKSAILLAGLYAQGETSVVESEPSRDHTERLLSYMGADIHHENNIIKLNPGRKLQAKNITIPGDISSAAFFIVAASMTPGAHIVLCSVGINPLRMGVIHILQAMGADIELHEKTFLGNEPVAHIEVKGTQLQGIYVPEEHVVSAIDEFPAIFMAAACAIGKTVIRGIEELRFKETDRIAQMTKNLRAMGVSITLLEEGKGVIIEGKPYLLGATLNSGGDHRIAMACAMGALRAKAPIIIQNTSPIATSFPNFNFLATMLGMSCLQDFS